MRERPPEADILRLAWEGFAKECIMTENKETLDNAKVIFYAGAISALDVAALLSIMPRVIQERGLQRLQEDCTVILDAARKTQQPQPEPEPK